jgi:hypothetical protein
LRPAPTLDDHAQVSHRHLRDTGLGALLAIFILGVNVGSVSARLGFLHKAKQVKETDQWRYIEMARDPGRTKRLSREATYCWRVFVPTTARLLMRSGLSLNLSFWLITNVSLFGFLVVTWIYLRDLGFELPYRAAGLALLGLTQGAVRWYEYQYWMTDPPALLLIGLALLIIRRRGHAALYLPSIVGALVREAYVVVYPYYFIHLLKRGASLLQAVARTASVAVVPLALLIGLRVFIVPDHPDDFLADLVDTMGFRLRHIVDQPYVFTVGAWGVLFPLLLLSPRRLPGLVRRHPEDAFMVVFFASLCLVANNTERELAYALPAVLPAALFFLRGFVTETRLPVGPVLAATVLMQVLFFLEQRWGRPGMSMYQPTSLRLAAAMAVFWLAAQITLHVRGARETAGRQ